MRVTELQVYPVKSLGGVSVGTSVVEPWGLAGDRRWGLVDDGGEMVTAREAHQLLALRAEPVEDGRIRLVARGDASILVDTPLGLGPVPINLSRQASAVPADEDVNDWLTGQVGRRVRLVWQEDPTARTVAEPMGGMPGDHLSLADAGPVLLTSQASLEQLNDWIEEDRSEQDGGEQDDGEQDGGEQDAGGLGRPGRLTMQRFRPNVVIDGGTPFEEDGWPTVRIGDVDFRTTMVCDRCVMTTIDPVSLLGGPEPIRTLARHRRWEGATWFGTRLVALGVGTVRVGDAVSPGIGV